MPKNRSDEPAALADVARLIAERKLTQSAAARQLGITRQALARLLKRHRCPLPRRQPKLRHHRPTNQAFIEIGGRREYLGRFGSAIAEERYHARLAQLAKEVRKAQEAVKASPAADDQVPAAPTVINTPDDLATLSVNGLLRRFWEYKELDYRRWVERGGSDVHLENLHITVSLVADHAGELLVRDFEASQVFAMREALIDRGCCRGYINKIIGYAKHIFRWGTVRGLVDELVAFRVSKVPSLQPGETSARETEDVEPVPDAWVEPIFDFVAPCVAAMMKLQRLTGMRSDNVTAIRGCDLNMSGDVWIYAPARHKMSFRGHRLRIALGPKAQEVLRPFLRTNLNDHLFQPAEAARWHRARKAEARKTRRQPSQIARMQLAKGEAGIRRPGERYTSKSYYRAVVRGIEKCNQANAAALRMQLQREPTADELAAVEVPAWHPHRLRHALITEVRKKFGLEVAQIAAGHRDQKTTERYSRMALSDDHASRMAREIG